MATSRTAEARESSRRTSRQAERRSKALLAMEAPRAAAELVAHYAALPLLRFAPRGDGHPVMVLPGFTASDDSTRPLRRYLAGLGYNVHGWGLGVNVGPNRRLSARLEALHDLHGRRLSLVGWSLGGIHAREMARENPERIRQVITLGSPFRLSDRWQGGPVRTAGRTTTRPPLPVPTTAIFSRSDGVVPGNACCEWPGEQSETIEVLGSHCGLGHHPAVVAVIADRLAQPEGRWKPFRRSVSSLLLPAWPVAS